MIINIIDQEKNNYSNNFTIWIKNKKTLSMYHTITI